MRQTELTPEIVYLEPNSMTNYQACAGLMIKADRKIIIDGNLGAELTTQLLEKERPELAFVTHFHLDHSAWAHRAARAGSKVNIPARETAILSDLETLLDETARPFGLEEPWRKFVTQTLGFQPLKNPQPYEPGLLPVLKQVKIEILDSSGHSPGHSSFWFADQKILFCGDMGIDRFGPWYGWYNCDLAAMIESICRLRALDTSILLTSHGGMISRNIKRTWDQALGKIRLREKRIVAGLEKGLSKKELIRQGIFFVHKEKVAEPLKTFFYMWDAIMLDHHLRLLKHGGLRKLIDVQKLA